MGGLVQVLPRDWVRSDLVTMLAVRGKKVLVAYNDTVGDISVCDHEFADVEEARAWAERVGKEVGGDR